MVQAVGGALWAARKEDIVVRRATVHLPISSQRTGASVTAIPQPLRAVGGMMAMLLALARR